MFWKSESSDQFSLKKRKQKKQKQIKNHLLFSTEESKSYWFGMM